MCRVPSRFEELEHPLLIDHERGRIHERMALHGRGSGNRCIEIDGDYALCIIDETENGHGTRLHAEEFSQAFRRCKRNLRPAEHGFEALQVDVFLAPDHNERMRLCSRIVDEQIFRRRPRHGRKLCRLLAGEDRGMVEALKCDAVLVEESLNHV